MKVEVDSTQTQLSALQRDIAILQQESGHRRELIDDRFKATQRALEVALTANEKRLDGLNEFRAALDDMSKLMITRTEVDSKVNAVESKADTDIKVIRDKLELIGRPNYILGVSALTAVLIAIGGLWTVTGLKIDNAIAPLTVTQEAFRTMQVSQDREMSDINFRVNAISSLQQTNTAKISVSEVDRAQLNSRIKDLDQDASKHEADDRKEVNELRVMVTRLNVWLDMIHAMVFPKTPAPPLKQP